MEGDFAPKDEVGGLGFRLEFGSGSSWFPPRLLLKGSNRPPN